MYFAKSLFSLSPSEPKKLNEKRWMEWEMSTVKCCLKDLFYEAAEEDFLDSEQQNPLRSHFSLDGQHCKFVQSCIQTAGQKKKGAERVHFLHKTSKDKPKSVMHTWTNLFYFTLSTQWDGRGTSLSVITANLSQHRPSLKLLKESHFVGECGGFNMTGDGLSSGSGNAVAVWRSVSVYNREIHNKQNTRF